MQTRGTIRWHPPRGLRTIVSMRRLHGLALVVVVGCNFGGPAVIEDAKGPPDIAIDSPPDAPGRVRKNLIALYSLNDGTGSVNINDTSPAALNVQLTIADTTKVTWGSSKLTIDAKTPIATPQSVPCPV